MSKKNGKAKYNVWIAPFTHWDRAWYLPFEGFRGKLVDLIDRLLEIYDKHPYFNKFSMDGQTIPIEDYLEIRPENEEKIKKAVRSGKLKIGPWYVLPDLYLVSGEAIIRNLLIGKKIAKKFGRIMNCGFVPDPFGHPRMMPAIMNGFEIDSYIFTRGAPPEAAKCGVVFEWKSPDGSSVIATRQVGFYGNLARWGAKKYHPDYHPDYDIEEAMKRYENIIKTILNEGLATKNILLGNGTDHKFAQFYVPYLIKEANKRFPEFKAKLATFDEYTDAVRKEKPKLNSFEGELHSGYLVPILSGTFSTRMWIKQENFSCEKLLETGVEPLDAFASHLGFAPKSPFITYAWKTLLKSHPHDNVCGCSVDDVHRDDIYIFRHVKQVSLFSIESQLRTIGGSIKLNNIDAEGISIIVFNPVPYSRSYNFLELSIPGIDPSGSYYLKRADGKTLPVQIYLSYNKNTNLSFFDPELPPTGYAIYHLEKGVPPVLQTDISAGENYIENKYFKVILSKDCTIKIIDKETSEEYDNIHIFEDTEDTGDEYDYSSLPEGKSRPIYFHNITGCISQPYTTPGLAEISWIGSLSIPQSLTEDRSCRSDVIEDIPVKLTIRLQSNTRRIEFITTITNKAKDHRLRIHFATGISAKTVKVAEHFDIVERPVEPWHGTENHNQPTSRTQHMKEFVAVYNDKRGFMLTTKGLPEYESYFYKDNVNIALTLLRCCGWLSRNDLLTRKGGAGPQLPTPEAQCLGTYTFEYAIIPFKGDPVSSGAAKLAYDYSIPSVSLTLRNGPDILYSAFNKRLPPIYSFIKIEPENAVFISAIKSSEDKKSIVIRLYNPVEEDRKCLICFCSKIKEAKYAMLNEREKASVKFKGNKINLTVKSHEIVTLLVKLDRKI